MSVNSLSVVYIVYKNIGANSPVMWHGSIEPPLTSDGESISISSSLIFKDIHGTGDMAALWLEECYPPPS